MTSAWRALGARWRQLPAGALGPGAVAAVRDWQHALADAAPPRLAIDAWPREPDVQPLLEPMAQSPLAALRDDAAAAPPPAVAERATRRLAAPAATGSTARPAWATAPEAASTARAAVPAPNQAPSPLRWPAADGADATRARPAGAADAPTAAPGAAAARIATLLARHAAQRGAFDIPASAPAARSPLATPPRATAAGGNVVALHPRRAPREPRAGPAPALQRWGQLLDTQGNEPKRFEALLERGGREPAAMPALPPVARSRTPRAEPLPPPAEAAATALPLPAPARPGGLGLPPAAPPTAPAAPLPAAPWPEAERAALAGLAASLARIEGHLAAPAPAEAPQWLDDDEHLADRIHDILRRQARRHGIDTP